LLVGQVREECVESYQPHQQREKQQEKECRKTTPIRVGVRGVLRPHLCLLAVDEPKVCIVSSVPALFANIYGVQVKKLCIRLFRTQGLAAGLLTTSQQVGAADRKSTRLNSSHLVISYAV